LLPGQAVDVESCGIRGNGSAKDDKALGGSAEREVVGVKKRVLSAAGRAAI